jgi:hypothetical protein
MKSARKSLTWPLLFLALTAPAEAGILRYTYRAKDSSADPTARIPQVIVADTEAECPSSDVGDGDLCYGKDTDALLVRAAASWTALGGGSVTLAGDVDGASGSNDLDESAVEGELEGVLDLADLQGSLTLAGDVDGAHGATDLDEASVEAELEAVLDLQDQQGAVTDAQVPDAITVDLATTATTANAGDSATAFFPTGTLEDARVDGSAEADELVLAGDVDGAANAGDLDEAAVESELESVMDLADLQGDLALGTKTSGNYAAGDAEAGAATTGDSASSFFGAGQLEAARGGTGIDTSASTGRAIVTAGTWSVSATMPVTQILLCPPGMGSANVCVTYTDLGAAFATAGAGGVTWADLAGYTEYRISVLTGGTGATTGDVVVQCDTVVNFAATPTTLGQVDNPGANAMTCSTSATCSGSSWAAIGAGECLTAGGIFLRAGMANGNTTEDPVLRRVLLELR